MIDAFVACGGQPNKHGIVKKETLVKIIKHDFGLTIDIEELINKIDTDQSGALPPFPSPPPTTTTTATSETQSSLSRAREK